MMQLTALHVSVFAQEKCGTVPYMQQLRNEGKLRQTEEQFEQWMARKNMARRMMNQQSQDEETQRTQGGPYQIPVVVHIIHNGEPIDSGTNISDAQILSQIEVINKDFKRLNTDAVNTPSEFQPFAGSMDVEFILARRDPNGLPTTGINRVQGTKTAWTMSDNAIFKSLSYWNSNDYLNIWVVKFTGSTVGYAQFPVSELEGLESYRDGLAATDGVAIDYLAFGTIDAGPFDLDPKFNKGRTATHEIGHFFGLRHIWGDLPIGCLTSDYVEDTPNQSNNYNGQCPLPNVRVSCGSSDMYMNYMDYTNDACMNIFTTGQVERMEIILNDDVVPRRKSLLTSPGLLDPSCTKIDVAILSVVSPGIINCDEQAEFKINIRNVSCSAITSVKTVHSVNGNSSVSNTISLSTPLAINEQRVITIPAVNFSEGRNTISLQVTEANSKPDEDPNNSSLSITILVDKSQDRIPLRENFDVLNWPTVSPQDGIVWQVTGTNFGNSATVQAFSNGTIGNESWLASPVLDFSNTTIASMFFDLSYAWNQMDNDRLRILASTDCGVTYQPLPFNKSDSTLSNAFSTNPWLPTNSSQWQLRHFLNLNALAGQQQVRLAFVFTNATGNNLYLDNIEFFVSDNPNPVDIGNDLYSIYWQTNFEATITFDLPERMPVGVYVVDVMGREYINTTAPDILNQTFPIELNGAATGIYIMKIRIGNQFYTSKFFLSR